MRTLVIVVLLALARLPTASAVGIDRVHASDEAIEVVPAGDNPATGHLVALEFGDTYSGDRGWTLTPGTGGAVSLATHEQLTLAFVPPSGTFGPVLSAPAPVSADQVRYVALRARVLVTTNAIPVRLAAGGGFVEGTIPADGSWHIVRADLGTIPGWTGDQIVQLAVGVGGTYSEYQNVSLDIDWISVNDDNTYTGGLDYTRYDRFWDLGYPAPVFSGGLTEPIILPRYDSAVDRMYCRYLLVDDNDTPIGGAHYVDDWSGLSYLIEGQSHRVPLPEPTGINGIDDYQPVDFEILQPDCGKLNVVMASFIDQRPSPAFTWTVDGIAIGLNLNQFNTLVNKIRTLNDMDMTMYLVLLNTSSMGTPTSDSPLWPETAVPGTGIWVGHNTFDPLGRLYVRAFLEYLSYRLSLPGEGAVTGYIIGNEVDAHPVWHQVGPLSDADFIAYHAGLLRLADLAIRKYHPESRVLISLTHFWTNAHTIAPKTLLEDTADLLRAEGDLPWGLAHHPYPRNLFEPTWWDDAGATLSLNSSFITYRNIEVIAQFLAQEPFRYRGAARHLAFTEQGFHTPDETTQAAAYAYAYRKMLRIPQLDAHVMHRYQDHPNEGGLLLGIRDLAGDPKESYTLFQYANDPDWTHWFNPYLSSLPISSFDEAVPTWGSLNFHFDEDGFAEGWQNQHHISNFAVAGGVLSGQTTGGDPQLQMQSFFASTDAAPRLLVRMRSDTNGTAQLFWKSGGQGFSEARSATFPLVGDNQFHLYELDLSTDPEWTGALLNGLRFDPINTSGATFEVDYIRAGQVNDFDSDGITDVEEGGASVDSDNDLVPDFADEDSDGDTIRDAFETTLDTDGDTIPDYLDLDSDGDGASDQDEREAGIAIYSIDDDGDGLLNQFELPGDADNDGVPNRADPDADGDGTRDGDEVNAARNPWSPQDLAFEFNQDGHFERWDDALRNVTNAGVSAGSLVGEADTADPQLAHLAFQFNGDAVPAIAVRMRADQNDVAQLFWGRLSNEVFSGTRRIDVAYTGNGDWAVLTFDGSAEPEWSGETITQLRFDPTKKPNTTFELDWIRHADGDLDDDGISDTTEGTADFDNDGTPDFLDLDSDNDQQSDADEWIAGTSTTDPNDRFIVTAIQAPSGTGIVVNVAAKPGRTYFLQRSQAPFTNEWTQVLELPSPGDQPLPLPDPTPVGPAHYRVRVAN